MGSVAWIASQCEAVRIQPNPTHLSCTSQSNYLVATSLVASVSRLGSCLVLGEAGMGIRIYLAITNPWFHITRTPPSWVRRRVVSILSPNSVKLSFIGGCGDISECGLEWLRVTKFRHLKF